MQLTLEDKNILKEIYGANCLNENSTSYVKNQIEDVQKLTAAENEFFERKNFVSPYFCVQTLYKVNGELSPIKFNHAVKNLIEADENFRANFCNSGERGRMFGEIVQFNSASNVGLLERAFCRFY